jgi:hypothetical protein
MLELGYKLYTLDRLLDPHDPAQQLKARLLNPHTLFLVFFLFRCYAPASTPLLSADKLEPILMGEARCLIVFAKHATITGVGRVTIFTDP